MTVTPSRSSSIACWQKSHGRSPKLSAATNMMWSYPESQLADTAGALPATSDQTSRARTDLLAQRKHHGGSSPTRCGAAATESPPDKIVAFRQFDNYLVNKGRTALGYSSSSALASFKSSVSNPLGEPAINRGETASTSEVQRSFY